ncbi:hypothetical protein LTR91_014953 [Friedmanniomyces endolithicus]|uniref:Uncharacterized protein n=2 Tax=Friedmanniomyces endolithicus TaxID=329885 RepID=A0AAN6FZZ5_9PEZI|nr:hypothetical protein LTS09_016704 [Friedmanniomyces endolithicus]KAK0327654.1 hypothetical protein LTR82_001170 [Friedmanniomyces endolithicus]KAK0922525.1 hypothetical protein LTR57_007765 [Friedmanniomyces endolithicus]KAK0972943.1 hypothetical protein LTR91_014953 [Friedmanniomyces endolithicus]KAK0989617.1 hypothetical protein LTS01_008779 [Friedmanniomyces endolithicus]
MTPPAWDRERMSVRRILAPQSPLLAPVATEGSNAPRLSLESAVSGESSDAALGNQLSIVRSLTLLTPIAIRIPSRMSEHSPCVSQLSSSVSTDSAASSGTLFDRMTSARAPRISYSEEQRFFIMYTRIVLCMSWQEIESGYAKLFGQDAVGLRSRGGLTSVYYRIRKRWGLEEVLKAAPETVADKLAVLRRAEWLPSDFLAKIGELQT